MIADLDISSEKAEETLDHQEEEIRTFNNNLFNPVEKPIPNPRQEFKYGEPSPIIKDPLRTQNQESEFQWHDYDDAQKDTLELNYQAELQGEQHSQENGSSQQPGRIEDLLKDADMALRRSQYLASLHDESMKHSSPLSQHEENIANEKQEKQQQEISTTTASSHLIKGHELYTQTTYSSQESPEKDIKGINPPSSYSPEIHSSWNESNNQVQSTEPWKSTQTFESKYFSPNYGSKLKAAYDLFPIQEALESGVETPRESSKSNFNSFVFSQPRTENSSDKLKAIGFTQPTTLAEQILRNHSENKGSGNGTPVFGQVGQRDYPIKHNWESVPTTTRKVEEYQSKPRDEKPYAEKSEGNLSNRSMKTDQYDPFGDMKYTSSRFELDPTREGMDKKIDDILKKHFGPSSIHDSERFSETNSRSSFLERQQREWKYSVPEQGKTSDGQHRATLSLGGSFKDDYNYNYDPKKEPYIPSDSFVNPFHSAIISRQGGPTINTKEISSALITSPGNPLLTLTSPSTGTLNRAPYSSQDNFFESSSGKLVDLKYSPDQFYKPDTEYAKRSGNYPNYERINLTSPQGAFPKLHGDVNAQGGFKFSSPLVQKYSNPFIDDYFTKNGGQRKLSPGKLSHPSDMARPNTSYREPISVKSLQNDLVNFEPKIVESKEQSPEKERREQILVDNNNPYYFSSQNIYSPPLSGRDNNGEPEFIKPPIHMVKSDIKSLDSSPPVVYYSAFKGPNQEEDKHIIEDFDDPFGEETHHIEEKLPKTKKIESNLKGFQPNPSENIEEDFENMNLMFENARGSANSNEVHSPLEFPESTPGKFDGFLNSDRRFEQPHEISVGQETTPDKKLKKLTFKNKVSEEKHHDKKEHEEHLQEKTSERAMADMLPETKQRKKIFEEKVLESEKPIPEEIFNNEKESDRNKKIIFSEIPKRKGKDLEILLEPLQEQARKATPEHHERPISERAPPKTQITPKERKSEVLDTSNALLSARRDSEKFPFQLKNGVLDPTESFFDFENENFLTNEDYVKQQITQKVIEKPVVTQANARPVSTVITQPQSMELQPQEQIRKKPVSGRIWILDISNVESESVDLANPQTISQNLKKVPIIIHCFAKFRSLVDSFPNS